MSIKRSSSSSGSAGGRGQSSLGYLFGTSTTNNDRLDQQTDSSKQQVSSPPVTCNSGGGQSSLGYLFGSNAALSNPHDHQFKQPAAACHVSLPPYGTHDMVMENTTADHRSNSPLIKKDNDNPPSPKISNTTCVYHKVDGKNSGDFFITGRPSTRVTSVPGGDSSIGYLFGDK